MNEKEGGGAVNGDGVIGVPVEGLGVGGGRSGVVVGNVGVGVEVDGDGRGVDRDGGGSVVGVEVVVVPVGVGAEIGKVGGEKENPSRWGAVSQLAVLDTCCQLAGVPSKVGIGGGGSGGPYR